MSEQHGIADAGNVVVPAVLALEAAGFELSEQEGGTMIAVSDRGTFIAESPVALLGLVKLIELRGWSWQATDTEINTTIERFGWGD
ncbi:hypothetical protein [Kribbella pratensis]|uniref:Uncharacterized protein n=1 Tax=Kribbella pratensis TaxID=2512112 RepID=A0A4R8BWX1_9ACTN|nr:hypothetical protein [Kribbella pratensis]TDW66331.1 hypothetical protein EV653_6357 [Kribbella pratensis]